MGYLIMLYGGEKFPPAIVISLVKCHFREFLRLIDLPYDPKRESPYSQYKQKRIFYLTACNFLYLIALIGKITP